MSDAPPPPSEDTPVVATAVHPAPAAMPQIIIQQNGGLLTFYRLLALVGWAGFLLCGVWAVAQLAALAGYFDTTEGLTEKYHSGAKFASDKVAVVHVDGVIMEGDGFVKKQIDRVREDENVRAVVVRVNSPGGTITGSDYIYHHLKKLREDRGIPVVVSMGSMATSGGYYVAMAVGDQEESIFAEPTTTTGSIGVIVPHYDISGLMGRFDIKDDSIASHPRKQMLSMTRPMNEEERQLIERYVNVAFERFKKIVKEGRPRFRDDDAALEELATGEIFTADQALESGLVDRVGFIEAAIERAQELAGLDPDETRVIEFEQPLTLLDLAGFASGAARPATLESLLELSVPRAYFLCTSLPPLATSYRPLSPSR